VRQREGAGVLLGCVRHALLLTHRLLVRRCQVSVHSPRQAESRRASIDLRSRRLQPRLLKCPWDFIECRQR
jgi:hypothetical protein